MAVLKIRDENGEVREVLALRGEKGDKGDKGDRGEKGDSYTLTEVDKAEITQAVLAALPNGDEVGY